MKTLAQELRIYSSGNRRRPALKYEAILCKVPPSILDKFELSHCDEETAAFLQQAASFSLWKLFVSNLLRTVVSRTTANGLLGRGNMFVVSTAQARQLLRPAKTLPEPAKKEPAEYHLAREMKEGLDESLHFGTLLDIGAGDGGVTAKLQPLFDKIFATEYSATMRWRLRRRGYEVLGHEDPFHDPETKERRLFDVITCFNVLDRADTPLTLLRDMRDSLKPETGLLLLAVVLPWCPFVEYNSQQRRPRELLPMQGGQCCKGASFEESLSKLVENVLEPVGFELVRWTRLPYLCEGNLRLEYALLHDAVFVLKRKPPATMKDTATLAPASDYA